MVRLGCRAPAQLASYCMVIPKCAYGAGMERLRLIIVCGVPGSGKSTFAIRAAERWGAAKFASEIFAEELGPAARTASGDLSNEAIAHAYSEMGAAVRKSFQTHRLVVAVGSFRAELQRARFREIATSSGASATTVRIICPVEISAQRIRSRLAFGERGPTEKAIVQIEDQLNRACDIDLVVHNDSSVAQFHQQVDSIFEVLLDREPARANDTAARLR